MTVCSDFMGKEWCPWLNSGTVPVLIPQWLLPSVHYDPQDPAWGHHLTLDTPCVQAADSNYQECCQHQSVLSMSPTSSCGTHWWPLTETAPAHGVVWVSTEPVYFQCFPSTLTGKINHEWWNYCISDILVHELTAHESCQWWYFMWPALVHVTCKIIAC